jgi:hypothetical protein
LIQLQRVGANERLVCATSVLPSAWHSFAERERPRLEALGGRAGFLVADSPIPRPNVDAVLLSTQNALE